jgi:translocation and assembly module TamB
MKPGWFKKACIIVLISITGLILLLVISINLPFGRRFITERVNNMLIGSDIPVHIASVGTILPKSVTVIGITLYSSEGDTIAYVGEAQIDIVPLALLKKRIILPNINLNNTRVNITVAKDSLRLNTPETVSGGKKDKISKPAKVGKSWEVSVGNARLSGLKFQMDDFSSGIHIIQQIREVILKIDKMSLPEKTLIVRSLEIDGSIGSIQIDAHHDDSISKDGLAWNIGLGKLTLKAINLLFNDTADRLMLDLNLGEASIKINKTDPKKKVIYFDKISINETSIYLRNDTTRSTGKGVPGAGSLDVFPWAVNGKGLDLGNVSLDIGGYDVSTAKSRFSISNLDMSVADIKLNGNEAAFLINKTSFDLGNGFSVKKMKGKLDSHLEETQLRLSAETGNSLLSIEVSADGNIFDILNNPYKSRKAAASISSSKLSLKDLLLFKPELQENSYIASLYANPFEIDGSIRLLDSAIIFQEIGVKLSQSFGILLKGKINNIFQPGNPGANLQFGIPYINADWLKRMLKGWGYNKVLPEFGKLSVNGSLSDSLRQQYLKIELRSDLGNINLIGSLDLKHDSFSARYSFDKLLLDKILGYPLLGPFYGSGEISCSGLSRKAVVASMVVLVDSMRFKNYNYTKTRIECKLDNGTYDLSLLADDPSLHCDLKTFVNTTDSILSVRVNGSFYAQLNNIHLFKDTLNVDGKINAGFKKYGNLIDADVGISELKLLTPKISSIVHQIKASFSANSLRTSLIGKSDFFDLDVQIEKPLSELGTILDGYKDYAESFINPKHLNAKDRTNHLPEMKATLNIKPTDEFRLLSQDTTFHFTNIGLELTDHPVNGKLSCSLIGRDIRYKNIKIGILNISLSDSSGIMNLDADANNCVLYTWHVNKLQLTNRSVNWQSITRFDVLGDQDKTLYNLELSSVADSNNIVFKVPSKQLILNGIQWNMDTSGLLTFNRISKSVFSSLKMHTDNSFISIQSENEGGMHSYKCNMSNLTFASLLPDGVIPGTPAGSVSGSVDFGSNLKKGIEINSDLKFSEVRWSDLAFNNLAIKGNFTSNRPEDYSLEMTAILDSSVITLNALKPSSGKRTLNAEFTKFPIHSFQPFVRDILSDLKGDISGKFDLVSTNETENLKGELNISKADFKLNTLNSNYTLPGARVLFTGEKMVLNKFRILDSLNNELLVDGSIDFNNLKSVSADLEIGSSKLQVMNRTEKENSPFYGNIYIDSHISVRGPLSNPEVKGKILLTGGTEVFFRQKEDLNLTESEKVLTFVKKNPSSDQKKSEQLAKENAFNKTAVEALVDIDPSTKLNISLSKKLYNVNILIRGGGELNFNMLINKQINLAGKYIISDGTAEVKMTGWPNKSFRIMKGGFIQWDGKLEDPELQFEAVNKVRSSYTNPVDKKERDVDFNVTLKLSNRLSSLDVLFGINTPDQYLMSIINTLSPEEQMRQAITILLFAKIDLPGISTSSDYMTEQVNQIVATQLNQLTKTTLKGIDISFGLDSYVQSTQAGSQETKTSLSYDVKKAFLNNRAQIELSGRLNDVNAQPGTSDLSLNNFSFEYRLDSSGTKFLKVYNEHTYEDVFEGEVIKTGVGLTFRKRYKTLADIWKREEKKKKLKIQDK